MILVIRPHSTVDVITNSSTELFTCQANTDIDMITNAMDELYDAWKKSGSFEFDDEVPYTIGRVSKEEKENYHNAWGFFSIEEGDIYIKGITDNSIPYEWFEFIEDTFGADRYHQG